MAQVVRLGSWIVNWYLVEDGGRVAIVDGGLPKFVDQLAPALAALGRTEDDVAAIVLTHAHADHVGTTELLRTRLRVPVYVHEADEELARTAKQTWTTDGSMLPYLARPTAWRLLTHFAVNGAARRRPIAEVQTYGDGAELDVPGALRVVHTPGHTPGHCALVAEGAGAVLAGDALCTLNPLTGNRAPQLMPSAFNSDTRQALASLDRLEHVPATTLFPGHGEPADGVEAAVAEARRRGPS